VICESTLSTPPKPQSSVPVTYANDLDLRQSYTRFGNFALIRHQRYAHAKQFSLMLPRSHAVVGLQTA
jgi:hypothetical protein